MNNKINWLIFDVSGVLVELTLMDPEGYKFGGNHYSQKEIEGLYYTQEYKLYLINKIDHNTFLRNYFTYSNLGIDVSEFDKFYAKDVKPMKGMNKLVTNLSKKYKIALATNEGEYFSDCKIEKSGIKNVVTNIVTSHEIQMKKPDLDFFNKTLEIIHANPSECLFVDDDIKNIESASSLGISCIHFKNYDDFTKDLNELGIVYT